MINHKNDRQLAVIFMYQFIFGNKCFKSEWQRHVHGKVQDESL